MQQIRPLTAFEPVRENDGNDIDTCRRREAMGVCSACLDRRDRVPSVRRSACAIARVTAGSLDLPADIQQGLAGSAAQLERPRLVYAHPTARGSGHGRP